MTACNSRVKKARRRPHSHRGAKTIIGNTVVYLQYADSTDYGSRGPSRTAPRPRPREAVTA
jgi:hypothetical protein